MKKTIYLVMMMIATMIAFNACSNDDDDDDDKGNVNGNKELEFVIDKKAYKLKVDEDATYNVKKTEFKCDLANEDVEDLVTLYIYSYAINLDEFTSSRLNNAEIELNKEYKIAEIGLGLRLGLFAPDKHNVENNSFDLNDNSTVVILEQNASKNYIKFKFSNMKFDYIDLRTGKVVESINIEGDFVAPITYKRS